MGVEIQLDHRVFLLASPPWLWPTSEQKRYRIWNINQSIWYMKHTRMETTAKITPYRHAATNTNEDRTRPDIPKQNTRHLKRGRTGEMEQALRFGEGQILPEKASCKWGGRATWDPDWRLLNRSEETGQGNKKQGGRVREEQMPTKWRISGRERNKRAYW